MENLVIILAVVAMLTFGAIGIPLAYGMAICAVVAAWLTTGFEQALGLIGDTAFGSMREYILVVIPLFDAMGFLVARSGAAEDLFAWVNRALGRMPAKFAVATVAGNAIFATVTGIGAVAAVTFSRIAYPQMRRFGYDRRLSFGCVAGSSVLGLFLPPGILLIIWALLTEQSVGKLFMGAVIPGLLLATCFAIYCVVKALVQPSCAPRNFVPVDKVDRVPTTKLQERISLFGILALMTTVLGGLWGGLFTPTETSAFGLLGATILFKAKGKSWKEWLATLLDSGKMTAPLLMLLIAAQMFSRMLAFQGVTGSIQDFMGGLGVGLFATFLVMVFVWLVLGSMLDSVSIMLLTTPIFYPIAKNFGMDPIAFALSAILFIEAGLLHPPFGMAVYLVKASISEKQLTLADGFWGTLPFCFVTIGVAILIAVFPVLAYWLPNSIVR